MAAVERKGQWPVQHHLASPIAWHQHIRPGSPLLLPRVDEPSGVQAAVASWLVCLEYPAILQVPTLRCLLDQASGNSTSIPWESPRSHKIVRQRQLLVLSVLVVPVAASRFVVMTIKESVGTCHHACSQIVSPLQRLVDGSFSQQT